MECLLVLDGGSITLASEPSAVLLKAPGLGAKVI